MPSAPSQARRIDGYLFTARATTRDGLLLYKLEGHAIAFTNSFIACPVDILIAQARRKRPYAVGMIGSIFGIGLDLGFCGQLESNPVSQLDDMRSVHVARAGRGVLRDGLGKTMLYNTKHTARLQGVVDALEHTPHVLVSVRQPVMQITKRQDKVGATRGRVVQMGRRFENSKVDLAKTIGVGCQLLFEIGRVSATVLARGVFAVGRGNVGSVVTKIRGEYFGVPATARAQLHDRHRGLDAKELQGFVRVPGRIARHKGRRTLVACYRRF